MSFVLAIDSGPDRKGLLDQLTQELAGREFVVVPSCAEALDVIDRRVPDLVVFPVSMSAADEKVLTHRLQNLAGDDPSRLGLPLLSLARSTAASARWFYWFRPAAIQAGDDARAFTDGLREQLKAVLPVPVPVFVEAAFDRIAPRADEIIEPPYLDLESVQFEMPPTLDVVEGSEADRPSVWSRAADLVARG